VKHLKTIETIQLRIENYRNNPTKDNLVLLLLEVYDLSNVLEGIGVQEGVNMVEMSAEKDMKVYRTINIIDKIPKDAKCNVKAYNEIRKGY